MKKINAFIIGGVLTSLCMFACNDEDENAENNERNNQTTVTTSLKGSFLNHSECKGFENSNSFAEDYDFKYVFDLAKGTGTITHINNMMSCSMEDISTNVTIKGDSIFITETGIDTLNSNCICPYDITTQFKGVEKKLYHVIINPGFIDRCSFDIDLRKQSEGTWKKEDELKWKFLSHSECLGNPSPDDLRAGTAFNVNYKFDLEKGIGTITHLNVEYNCCPGDLYTDVRIKGDSIIITEISTANECRCVCLYDMTTQIEGAKKDIYHVSIIDQKGKHDFDLDLSKESEGQFAIE